MKKISLKKVSDEVAIIQVKISDTTIWVKAGKLYGRSEFGSVGDPFSIQKYCVTICKDIL